MAVGLVRSTDDSPDDSTVTEIQRKVTKKGKRKLASRYFHAKNDREKITTWRSDLNKILHIFNVRSIDYTWMSLTVHFQTELAINTHVTVSEIGQDVANTRTVVSDIHRGVANTQVIVSELRNDVVNTNSIVSDIHCNMLGGHGGARSSHPPVSIARTLSITE